MNVNPLRAQPRDVAQDRAISPRLQPPRQLIRHRRRSAARQLLACAVAAAGFSLAAHANEYWVGTSGNWDDLVWSANAGGLPGLPPPATGNAYITFNDALTRTVTFDDTAIAPALSTFQIGNAGGGQSVLAQSAGTMSATTLLVSAGGRYTLDGDGSTLAVSGAATVQRGGSFAINGGAFTTGGGLTLTNGSMLQSGGAVSVQGLTLSGTNGSTYTMNGGTLSSTGATVNGSFVQAGGAVTFGGLSIGNTEQVGPQGASYSMSPGTSLVASSGISLGVGNVASTFNQGSGSVRTNQMHLQGFSGSRANYSIGDGGTLDVALGIYFAGNVTYMQTGGSVTSGPLSGDIEDPILTLSGGSLVASGTSFFRSAGASLIQTGGTARFGTLYIAKATLDGNATLIVDQDLLMQYWTDDAQFTMRGGTATIGGALAGDGFKVSGGTLNIGGALALGRAISTSVPPPDMTQTGGDVRVGSLRLGGMTNSDNGTYYLSGGTLTATDDTSIIGVHSTQASFVQSGGTFTANAMTIGDFGSGTAGGSFALSAGDLRVSGDMTVFSANYSQSGGNAAVGGTLAVRSNYGSPPAMAVLSGGTLTAGLVSNTASFTFSGGTLNAPVLNQPSSYGPAQFILAGGSAGGPLTVTSLVNSGTVRASGAVVQFTGAATNNAAYLSSDSDNTFVSLTNGPAAYLQGGASDRFRFTGDLLSSSSSFGMWQTGSSTLEFQPNASSNAHTLSVAGSDLGGDTLNGYANNFAWGTLQLDSGQSLILQDGNATPGGALYVDVVSLAEGLGQINDITGNGLNVYYNGNDPANAYLGGQTYPLANGGALIAATPEPGGLAGLLAVGAAGWLRRRRRRGGAGQNAAGRVR